MGDLSRPGLDYIVWTAVGAPILLIVTLLGLLATGALDGDR